MTRNEYILELTKALSAMPYSEVNEIKNDIEAHFDEASAAGKSEEETAAALGDINDLAEEFLAGTSFKDAVRKLSKAEKIRKQQEKSAEYIKEHKYAEVSKVETSYMNNKEGNKWAVVLLNIIFGVPLGLLILFTLIGIGLGVVFAFIITGLLAIAVPFSGSFIVPTLFLTLAVLCVTLAALFLLILGVKYFAYGLKGYINWNKAVWNS